MNEFIKRRPPSPLVLAALGIAVVSAGAAPAAAVPTLRDMQVTIHARRALLEDAELSKLNLGVHVRNGTATVWGPVPSIELGKRAVQQLELVKGVFQVVANLYLATPKADDLPALSYVFDPPTQSASASPDRDSGRIGNLTGRVFPLPEPEGASNLHASVSLLAPVALADTPRPAAVPVPPPAPVAPAVESPAAAIDRLRTADERFRPIAAELQGGVVIVHGGTARGETVMAFAQAISQLPGVERVVLQNNTP